MASPVHRAGLPWSGTNRMLSASGLGPRLAFALVQADLPMTAAEFTLIMVMCFLAGAFVGAMRLGLLLGILIGVLLAYLPLLYLNSRRRRRQRAFSEQIPEILTLLVGALRAGYGLSQAIGVVVKQVAPPASVEFGRVMRAVGLGLPIDRALTDMANRIGTDEAGMLVTAINVQHETGGNLAQTLDIDRRHGPRPPAHEARDPGADLAAAAHRLHSRRSAHRARCSS